MKKALIFLSFLILCGSAAFGTEMKYAKPQHREAPASWFYDAAGGSGGEGGTGAGAADGSGGEGGTAAGPATASTNGPATAVGPATATAVGPGNRLCCLKETLLYLYHKPNAIAFREQSEWSRDIVDEAIADGLIPEFMQNIYTRDITRGEYALLLINLYEFFGGELICECAVPDTDAAGIGNKARMEYQLSIKREEAAVVAVRMMESLGCELRGGWPVFADEADIAAPAKAYVGKMRELGIFQGNDKKQFDPKGHMTVEQSVKIMMGVKHAVNKLRERKISVTDPAVKGKAIPILMYHAVADVPNTGNTNLFVRPSELEAQLKYIADNGYQTITFEDLENIGGFSKPVMLTFDDGYKCNYENLFPLLKKYGQRATDRFS